MKKININRRNKKELRHTRILNRLKREANDKLRLIVTKTNANIYAQIVDDSKSHTLVYVSSLNLKAPGNVETATKIGQEIAKRALAKNITEVTFDRGGHKYHGQVKAIADAAREGGLKF
jgi:large subunit ribosomal protein L18